MIDYEKLKEAHGLAEKYGKETGCYMNITCRFAVIGFDSFELNAYQLSTSFRSIDELLQKLQQLTQPKPKDEDLLFPTKQQLIQSQIDYWTKLKQEQK